jgi:alkylation response protein AidB-like acyl-CoA dehydrogenase
MVTVGAVAHISPAPGIDPDQGWTHVKGPMAAFEPVAEGALAEQAWSTWCAVRDRALAAEVVGLTQAILDLAVSHVTTREQFGRKLGSFQAVRHALADAMVQLEAAREAVSVAHASDSAWSAQAAWALAACAHRVTLRHAFQVSGAMGLTWEHSMHRYARRAMALELLSGPPSQRLEQIGKGLVGLGVVREPAL